MRPIATVLCIAAIFPLVLSTGCVSQRTIDTESLLHEMTDLSGLSRMPDPPFTCAQFSSYDRRSTTPDNHEDWFANADSGQILRVEEHDGRRECVIVDTDGPGAIVRIWSANPAGTLRIYLDNAEEPTIEAPMADLLGGQVAGLPEPIAGRRSAGWNLYFPIPYAVHCKVTGDEIDKQRVYYHVDYRTYPQGTKVVTFQPADLDRLVGEITRVADVLAAPPEGSPLSREAQGSGAREMAEGRTLAPGETLTWTSARRGSGAIYELRARVAGADEKPALARQILLTMEFDGQTTVACPLSDFFGAGPGVHPYRSLPMGVTEDGEYWSHWVMPYRKNAKLTLTNFGDEPVDIDGRVVTGEYRWNKRAMYFHAGWHVARDVPTRPRIDWNYVSLTGRGVFVGAAFSIANPVRGWWGEGDEKIYVDDATFPTFFGTGTEDYFGYAWCSPEEFTHAYHAQPYCQGPGNYGRTAVNRWDILDRIPFTQRFVFDMELWHSQGDTHVVEMSAVTYWYGRDADDNLPTPGAEELRLVDAGPYVAPRVDGALEGEEMEHSATAGNVRSQWIGGCSNERHAWWTDAQPGDELTVEFPVEKSGRYEVFAHFVKAGDYGTFRLAIDGQEVADTIDLYNDGVTVSKEISLGEFDLTAPEGKLTVRVLGANPKAVKSYMFGLDYLRLVPAKQRPVMSAE